MQSLGDAGGHGLVNGGSIHDEVVLAQGAKKTILAKVDALDVLGGGQHGDDDGGLLSDLQWALGDLDLILVVGIGVVVLQEVRGGRLVEVIDDKVGLVLESVEEVGGHGQTHVAQTNKSDSLDLGLRGIRGSGRYIRKLGHWEEDPEKKQTIVPESPISWCCSFERSSKARSGFLFCISVFRIQLWANAKQESLHLCREGGVDRDVYKRVSEESMIDKQDVSLPEY